MENGTLHTGTLIHGTLRPQDLLPAFLDAVSVECPAEYEQLLALPFSYIPAYAQEDESAEFWDSEECQDKINELADLLDSHASQFDHYFGAHHGDGSDFGFWPTELIQE